MTGRISNIDEVKDAVDIADIVGKFVTLKQSGTQLTGLCPFHDEKSPSFIVTPSKGIYKCFGCGESGDGIKFIMKHERKDFIEAIHYLADHYNIQLQIEEKAEVSKESKDELREMQAVNTVVAKKYFDRLQKEKDSKIWKTITNRASEDSILQWQIGYAPDEWKFITEGLIQSGKYVPAEHLGLVKRKNDQNYDFFRNRIIIPVHDQKGQVIAFGGRDLSGDKNAGKYLNSQASRMYNKSAVLYGLYFAAQAIRKRKCAYLVEGFFDVISMHAAGCENTVATCGTALTDEHCKILKKHTDHVIIIRDGDAAGRKALMKDIDILLVNNFKVDAIALEEGKDPDDVARNIGTDITLEEYLMAAKKEAVLYKAELLISKAGDDTDAYANAITSVAEMLHHINDAVKREAYLHKIAKKYKIKPKILQKEVEAFDEEAEEKIQYLGSDDVALPAWVKDKDQFYQDGFTERIDAYNTGYWFGSSSSKLTRLTNFVIRPLFHIYSKSDNKRMIEVTNGKIAKILDMPSKSLISLDQFRTSLFDEGFFVTEGGFTQNHLLKLVGKWGDKFPLCYELKTLGWQPEGFWAYSNYAFNGELKKFDDMGIVDIHDQKYLSLSVSKVQADVRSEEDIYENDRYLSYSEPPITFREWCELMVKVYDQNAWMGIAFAVMTIYRDVIFHITKVPHLYAYGAVQTGKSEFGDSISNLFFKTMPAFNLNQGTDFAFFSRMERFRNCPNALNEFDENGIKEEWFRAIKAAYDGEGREKGRGGKEGKTRTQKITCTVVLMGQYLSTKDDNSVLSRCIPIAFRENNNRTEEQISNFRKLKELERKGLSGTLIELLQLRDVVKKNYATTFNGILRKLMDEFQAEGKSIKSRILKNIVAPMTIVELLSEPLQLPFSKEQFYAYGKLMIENVSNLISESNSLAEFWRTIEFLLNRGEISEHIEFKIETEKSVHVMVDRESTQHKQFDEPKKVLYLRLNTVHTLYADIFKRKHNKPAPNLDTIRLYMKDQPYWIGTSPGSFFKTKEGKRTNTSSVILDYDLLKVNLEHFKADEIDNRTPITITGNILNDAEMVGSIVTATIVTTKTDGFPLKTETLYYKCYFHNVADTAGLTHGVTLNVTGLLTEKEGYSKPAGLKIYRSVDVSEFSFIENGTLTKLPMDTDQMQF